MKKEEVTKWLTIMKANLNSFPEVSNAKKIEALGEAIRLFKNEQSEEPTGSTTKNDLGVREFEEIVVEYPPEDLCTYPEYKGKPYLSIKYKEGNDCSVGYGTYNPKVFSRYLRDYFMPLVTPQEPRWIPVSEKLPEEGGDYLVTVCYDLIGKGTVREVKRDFFCILSKKWLYEGDEVLAWMPLPKPYREVEE